MQLLISASLALSAIVLASIHAELLRDVRNKNVDPCQDFYHYACGHWIDTTSLLPTDVQLDLSFDPIKEKNKKLLQEIIEKKYSGLDELWNSCMNVEKTTEVGKKHLTKDLNRIFIAKTKVDLMKLAGEFSRTGTKAFIQLNMKPSVQVGTTNTLYLIDPDLTLSTADYFNDVFPTIEKKYRAYINKLMKLSGVPAAGYVVSTIEQELAEIKTEKNIDWHMMSISDAKWNWPMTFDAFVQGLGINVNENLIIYVESPEYLHTIEKLIDFIPLYNLKHYLAFIMIHSRVQWLGADYYQSWFEFFPQNLVGQEQMDSQDTICMEHILKYVPDLIGKYYYDKAFDEDRKEFALKMITFIKEAMGNHISQAEWMDDEDKKQAQNKLEMVLPLIGQTESPKTYPSGLSRFDYPTNIYRILSHSFDEKMEKLGQSLDRMEWEDSSAHMNAFYNRDANSILFPAGILQPPLYNGPETHPARNFGPLVLTWDMN